MLGGVGGGARRRLSGGAWQRGGGPWGWRSVVGRRSPDRAVEAVALGQQGDAEEARGGGGGARPGGIDRSRFLSYLTGGYRDKNVHKP